MSYKTKPQIKLYKYENSAFVLQAIIDDFQECSFEDNLYEAGTFTISINYNIPNALKFERGLFVQFGNDAKKFGEILSISDAVGEDGKGSQIRTITGYDARYILKRRVIKNMNSNGLWVMTDKGEIVLRNLIKDQCGSNAETKRQLPISNTIPNSEAAIGKEYSVSESFSNLYEVCKTIATQSEIGWRIEFDGTNLNLVCYLGENKSQTVRFDTDYESLANGNFTDSSEAFSNAIYVGGKGQNDDRDIYEGEDAISGNSPAGLDRFECWDNQSSMTTESEYETEALSMLSQYGQTITLSGNGLAKCPYVYEEQYFVGDKITVAFSGKSAVVQILSVTEHWVFGAYDISFNFGKPQPGLDSQLQLILNQIQKASNKTNSKDSVRWYTIPTDNSMPASDVTYSTIGFIGDVGNDGKTFTLYRDASGTGSKTYHVYFKQLAGSGKLTLTTGVSGASNLVLNAGTYVAIIYVDENGNVTTQGATPTDTIENGNNQPATSNGVAQAISSATANPNVSNATGVLPIAHGGTGRTTSPNIQVDLASNSSVSELPATGDVSPGVTGTLPVANGGTGQTTLALARNAMGLGNTTGALPIENGGTGQTTGVNATNALISSLPDWTADPTDDTKLIRRDTGGTISFGQVKFSTVWNYIKNKIQNVGSLIIGVASTVGTKLKLKGQTVGTNTYADNNPKIVFENTDASQNVSLTFTDYDAVQSPASLTLNGNQGGEYFIAPNMRAIQKFKGVVEAGSYRSESTSSAKLKIKINSTADWMLCFTVVLYQSYRETKIMISGYQYGNSYWYSPQAVVLGDSSVDGRINVYFGYDSVNNLWVGFDQRNYTGIAIVDVVNGYKAVSDYSTLFTITSVSSLGGTTQTTIVATFPKRLPVDNTIVKGSGGLQFEQISGATGNPANDWYSHLIMNHSNSGGYHVDFAFCFHSDDFRIRRQVNGSLTNWVQMIHSGNIGSQSVATADSAGKLTTPRKTYVTLGTASTTTTRDWSGDTTIPVDGTLGVDNGGTGIASLTKGSILYAYSTSQYGQLAPAKGAMYNTSSTTAPSYGTLPVDCGGTGQTSLANVSVGNATKLSNISVTTTTPTSADSGNCWAYITASKITTTGGYIVYSNGFRILWGIHTNTGGNVTQYVTFSSEVGVSFTQPPIINANYRKPDGSSDFYYAINIYEVSKTGFRMGSNSSFNNNLKFFWMAMGY